MVDDLAWSKHDSGESLTLVLYSVFQLPLVFRSIEVALRGGDESIRSNLPKLKATDANPMPSASWSGVGADQGPVVLSAIVLHN